MGFIKDAIEELTWRGFIKDVTDKSIEVKEEKLTVYAGFDPTAPSLHLGNLIPVAALRVFQKHGNPVIVIVGGATGRIGDPSGKSKERPILPEEDLIRNKEKIEVQIKKLLGKDVPVLDNYEWFKNFGLIDFLRDVGKYVSVNRLVKHTFINNRLSREEFLSFAEFTYPLLQAFDFLHLYDRFGCKVQIGGSDQWGNIVEGVELIQRLRREKVFGVTFPLLTTEDGHKIGKSEGGKKTLWLDESMTSPFDAYQYFIRLSDSDAIKLFRLFSLSMVKEEVENIIEEHRQSPELRKVQKLLAREVITWVHGKEAAVECEKLSDFLFSKDPKTNLEDISKRAISWVATTVAKDEIKSLQLSDLFMKANLVKSKNEFRSNLMNKGIRVNGRTVVSDMPATELFRNRSVVIIAKGKQRGIVKME
ncbi:tyrosine--tRNA ligase [Hydrogenivirga sp. 128-5-R1-1]|uniref:tyrosine--tRNA ligase n=1 Tax=Hydrogenivirga sp. 128-5-R1-1 TaxID=392423 RepID=UPI00015F339B|nr:tyrosine--tRNA ligase [Hydrogenivirga sp. 128-5-R1-1]EDP74866.1 tyrosyl-tRNA synthetase [Hydrogenivirga sp. 128-5-R1-1]